MTCLSWVVLQSISHSFIELYKSLCYDKAVMKGPQICRWYHSNGRKWRVKSPLMRVKEESEKTGLKLNIQKSNKIMASGPITIWQLEGEKVEAVTNFIFMVSRITVDGDCSHDFKRCLPLGRKAMTNLDSILKSRDITLLARVSIDRAMVLPLVMYACENCTMKKAEHQRIDAFKLWCWRRLLRVSWKQGDQTSQS